MMMLIIFLITDISMVGIFAGVYGNIAKYREGMLMGHIALLYFSLFPLLCLVKTKFCLP